MPEYTGPGSPSSPTAGENFTPIQSSHARDSSGVASGERLMDALYSPEHKNEDLSLEGLNGQVEPSRGTLTNLEHRHIQRGSFSGGHMVGLTGNANYRCDRFFGKTAKIANYRVVPGSSIEFYLPKESYVILTWTIGGASGGMFTDESDGRTSMGLVIDDWRQADRDVAGYIAPTGYRNICRSVHTGTTETQKQRIQRPHRDRVWSGHHFTTLNEGWHQAGIAIYQQERNVKLRARNMKVLWFPYPEES